MYIFAQEEKVIVITHFSSYKNHTTLVAVTPSGAVSFVYGGKISDRELTQCSGLLSPMTPIVVSQSQILYSGKFSYSWSFGLQNKFSYV